MTEAPGEKRAERLDAPDPQAGSARSGRRVETISFGVAFCVFLLGTAWAFRDLAGVDLTRVTLLPTTLPYGAASADPVPLRLPQARDQRFVVWVIARNARTWLSNPTRMFDAEICHPAPQSLALGEPVLTLGLLATPMYLVSRDPILTFNFVLVLLPLISALAMYLAVKQWTGSPTAGIVAGILYAFHVVKIADSVHPYLSDSAWTLLALCFAQRWLERGRWRDVLGLAGATALQIGGSLYPLLGCAFLGIAFVVAASLRFGLRQTRPMQWAVLATLVGAALYFAFEPFLAKTATGVLTDQPVQLFLLWRRFLPGETASPGWLIVVLCIAAFVPRRGQSGARWNPRWPLLISTVIIVLLATGGNAGDRLMAEVRGIDPPPALPNPYTWLATIVPGLGTVRAPMWVVTCAHLTLSALAGLGAARALAQVPPRLVRPAGALLVAVALLQTLRPGLPGSHSFHAHSPGPTPDLLAFFSVLDERGNTGPILEMPVDRLGHQLGSMSIIVAAYHHRRTSRCYNSFWSKEVLDTMALANTLPDEAAIDRLEELGFTTLLIYHPRGKRWLHKLRAAIDALAARPDARVTLINRDPRKSAYAIVPRGGKAGDSSVPEPGSDTAPAPLTPRRP